MSDSSTPFFQDLLDSAKNIIKTRSYDLEIDSTTRELLLASLTKTPELSSSLTHATTSADPEVQAASLFMAQTCLIGLTIANSVKHLVGLGKSKDAAGRETYSLGDTVSSLVLNNLAREYFPNYGILDEENGGYQLTNRRVFTIDPIDGSIGFTRGIDESWAVGMALYDQQAVSPECSGIVAAAIALPQIATEDQLVLGVVGAGCWNLAGKSLRVSQPVYVHDDPKRCVASIGHKDMRADVWDQGLKELAKNAQRLYAGIDIQHAGALTARGQLDVLIRAKQLIYDLAPIIGVVEAAGGKVVDFQGKTVRIPLDLVTEQHIVAWNGDAVLGNYLLELVQA